jgi:antitoxin (DNA-binding transcriptional repressor) of toxin-antitoxin stability system
VGVRELRDHLSAYLDVVKGGRAVKVTEHGNVIAAIVPMHISARTLELYRQGKVGLPRMPKGDPADFPKVEIEGGITDIFLEMREEERNG